MPYLETTDEFWDTVADGTFAKVLHTEFCEQKAVDSEGVVTAVSECFCRSRFRTELPERYAKALENDSMLGETAGAKVAARIAERPVNLTNLDDAPLEEPAEQGPPETMAERKAREKSERESAS